LDQVIGGIAAAILLVCFSLLVFSVFARYVAVGMQIDWILEVVVFLIAWAVMLGVARIEKRAGHIRVDFVLHMFPTKGQRAAEFLSLIFALVVGVFFVYAGILVVQDAIKWDERTDSTLRIPFWYYYLTLSVSFTIHAIFILDRIIGLLRGDPLPTEQDLAD
jgi:TRAP-type C4-dicarboxylate transport system permease small subunit